MLNRLLHIFKKKNVYLGLAIFLFFLGVYLWLALKRLTYSEFLHYLSSMNGGDQKQASARIEKYISIQKYTFLTFTPLLLPVIGVCLYALQDHLSDYFLRFNHWLKELPLAIKSVPKSDWAWALTIIFIGFCARFYLAYTRPVFFDEAYTYMNFTKKGFWGALTYYPLPNNHVLYSLCTCLFDLLPLHSILKIRGMSLLVCSFAGALLFLTCSKLWSPKTGLISLLLFQSIYPSLLYGYQARGYSMLLLFFVIGFYAVVQILKLETPPNKYWVYFGLSGLLGVFAVPTYLYAHATLWVYLGGYVMFKKFSLLTIFIKSTWWTIGAIVLVYLPIIIVSGPKNLFSNKYVELLSFDELTMRVGEHLTQTIEFLFGVPTWIFILAVICLIIIIMMKKGDKKEQFLLPIWILGTPPLLLLFHHVIPFPRTWIYLIIPIIYILGMLINEVKLSFKLKLLLVTLASLFLGYRSFNTFQFKERFAYSSQETFFHLKESEAKTIWCNHTLVCTNLKFYCLEEEQCEMELTESLLSSIETLEYLEENNPDVIIQMSRIDFSENYKLDTSFGNMISVFNKEEK